MTTNYIKVDYSYECPTDNYLDGTEFETIETFYEGHEFLYLIVNEENGTIDSVLRDWEAHDGRPLPQGHIEVKLDCAAHPLVAEVLSDYHDDYKDDDDYLDTPGSKRISTPEGYEEFEYEYPIHPDVLFDDLRSTYNFETNEVDLDRNTNEHIMGVNLTWEEIRKRRNYLLMQSDAMSGATGLPQSTKDEVDVFRQKLRDLPSELEGVDLTFIESSFPKTDIIAE